MGEQRFSIRIMPTAQKRLRRLPKEVRQNIAARIDGLAVDPHPQQAIPLRGADDLWRLRVGDYRIIYRIENRELIVEIIDIGHRRDVYRGL